MPYLGKYWRSPGEIWIKTGEGWRTCRTIIIQNRKEGHLPSVVRRGSITVSTDRSFKWSSNLPYIVLPGFLNQGPSFYFVSRKNSKQVDHYSTVGDAILTLGIRQSVQDPRRFLYIAKLTELILKHYACPFEGTLRKEVMFIIEAVCQRVLFTEMNVHVARKVVSLAADCLAKERHLYIAQGELYDRRKEAIYHLRSKLARFKVRKLMYGVGPTGKTLNDLPNDCLRMVLKCFSDHRDLGRLSQVNRLFHRLAGERPLWKSLCLFSFSCTQLENIDENVKANWKAVYLKLCRKSAVREYYSDILQFCGICHHLFWKNTSHECPLSATHNATCGTTLIPVSPSAFLSLFET